MFWHTQGSGKSLSMVFYAHYLQTALESPTIVGAQAANELLDINGVRASVVLTDYQHKTFVSARSIDEVNVQLLAERMGGGGHLNMAGAQLDCGVEEALEIVKHTIDKLHEEGEF